MVWDPKVHPRWPKGTPKPPGAGTFMDKSHMGTPAWAAAVSKQMGPPPTPKAGKSTPRPAKAAKATKAAVAAATPQGPTVKSTIPPAPTTKSPSQLKPGDVIEIPHPKHSYIAPTRGVVKSILDRGPKVDVVAYLDPPPKSYGTSNYTPQVYLPHRFPVTVLDSAAPKVSTDAELDIRAKRVDRALAAGTESDITHMRNGRWTTARAKLHQKIVDELWADAANVPSGHLAIMAGGPVGAGKSTVLSQSHGAGQYLMLAPDDAKEALGRHGAIPDIPGYADLSPMERSGLVHQESLHITEMLAQRAYAAGKNVVWDGTMGNVGNVQRRVAELRKQGYSIEGLLVDVPLKVSQDRAAARYRSAQREFEQGRGHGGRVVPGWAISATQGAKANFDSLRRSGSFDTWSSYDNSGAAPRLTGQG